MRLVNRSMDLIQLEHHINIWALLDTHVLPKWGYLRLIV